jgi:hypothetical protein
MPAHTATGRVGAKWQTGGWHVDNTWGCMAGKNNREGCAQLAKRCPHLCAAYWLVLWVKVDCCLLLQLYFALHPQPTMQPALQLLCAATEDVEHHPQWGCWFLQHLISLDDPLYQLTSSWLTTSNSSGVMFVCSCWHYWASSIS